MEFLPRSIGKFRDSRRDDQDTVVSALDEQLAARVGQFRAPSWNFNAREGKEGDAGWF